MYTRRSGRNSAPHTASDASGNICKQCPESSRHPKTLVTAFHLCYSFAPSVRLDNPYTRNCCQTAPPRRPVAGSVTQSHSNIARVGLGGLVPEYSALTLNEVPKLTILVWGSGFDTRSLLARTRGRCAVELDKSSVG